MAKINFHRVNGTPWGSFVSSVIRTWAGGKEAQQVEGLKFDELDIQISLNGVPLTEEEHERLMQVVNKCSDLSSLTSVRRRVTSAFDEVEERVRDIDVESAVQEILERVSCRLSSVDLSGFLDEVDLSYLADDIDTSDVSGGGRGYAIDALDEFKSVIEKI